MVVVDLVITIQVLAVVVLMRLLLIHLHNIMLQVVVIEHLLNQYLVLTLNHIMRLPLTALMLHLVAEVAVVLYNLLAQEETVAEVTEELTVLLQELELLVTLTTVVVAEAVLITQVLDVVVLAVKEWF